MVALKNMAIELDRTPTRDEFCSSHIGARRDIDIHYGSYSVFVQAAGLDPAIHHKKRKQLSNQIFERDIVQVIEEYVPAYRVERQVYTPTLVIGDTHFPFINQYVLDEIYKFAEIHKPKRVVQVGDLYDMYAHSKFPKSLNIYTPNQEEDLAVQGAKDMWAIIRKIVPDAECVQLKGNHDIRMLRRTLEVQPAVERAISKYLDDLMTFEGVTLITDSRQEYIVEGIEFIHGHRSKLGDHRDYALMNAVCGHIHLGGVTYKRIRGQTLWELNAGLVGDPESKALSYTAQKISHSTPGIGYIDEYGPRFIPVG